MKIKRTYFFIILVLIIFLPNITFGTENNNNPLLKKLEIEGYDLNPIFDQMITNYILVVPDETNRISINAIPDDYNAKVEIDNSGELKRGINVINIKVIAEDGINTQIYTLNITRGDTKKANANLKELYIEDYSIVPQFSNNVIDYVVEFDSDKSLLKVHAIPESENAKIKIIGNKNLEENFNNIYIEVTAEDETTVKIYKILARYKNSNIDETHEITEVIGENVTTENNENILNAKEKKNPKKFYIIFATCLILLIFCIILNNIRRRKGVKKNK